MRRKVLGAIWLVLATGIMLAGVGLAYGAANAVSRSAGPPGGLHILMVTGAVALDVAILLIALFLVTRLADILL